MQIIDLQLYLKTVSLTQISFINFLLQIIYLMWNGLVVYSYTGFNSRRDERDERKDFFIKLQDNSCARFLCAVFYATMKFSGLIITGKSFHLLFYFCFFGEGDWTKIQHKVTFPLDKLGLWRLSRKVATNQCTLTFHKNSFYKKWRRKNAEN